MEIIHVVVGTYKFTNKNILHETHNKHKSDDDKPYSTKNK